MNNRPFAGRTAAVIDLAKLRSNIANIKARLKPGVEFTAVMKGDGYRHGIAGLYPTLRECGIDSYAVAIWEEGKMLRDAGATESVLILGDTADDMLDEAVKYDLDLTLFSLEGAENMAAAARRAGKKQNVQIKLNTGMNRIGFPVCQESFDTIKKICEMDDLNVTGIFTHLQGQTRATTQAPESSLTYTSTP